jgi:uncharacterized protein YggE
MQRCASILLLVSCCSAAFGQFESNAITVTASSNTNLQPDQAIFSVTVQSSLNTGLDDVLAALQGSGITATNLSSVSTQQVTTYSGSISSTSLDLQWVFNLFAPLTNTKGTIATLTTLQQSIANLNNGLTLSFSIIGTQVSQQLAQSQTCSFPALIASATTQAQTLASASGLTLGSITALSSSVSNVVSNPFASVPSCAITATFSVGRR